MVTATGGCSSHWEGAQLLKNKQAHTGAPAAVTSGVAKLFLSLKIEKASSA